MLPGFNLPNITYEESEIDLEQTGESNVSDTSLSLIDAFIHPFIHSFIIHSHLLSDLIHSFN
jgi:hypothetical protein